MRYFQYNNQDNFQIQMLIKNIQLTDKFKQFKQALYRLTRQINGCYDFTTITPVHLLLLHFIILFPFTSILFKRTDYFITTVTQVFRAFLISNASSSLGVSIGVLYAAVSAMNLVMLGAVAAHFVFGSVFATLTKILSFSLKVLTYLVVPIVDLGLMGYLDMLEPSSQLSQRVLGGICLFTSLLLVAFILLSLKFQLRIMRKKNTFWNLDNDVHFYGLAYLVFKTALITLTDVSISLCLLSLGVWFYHRQLNGGCVSKQANIIQFSLFNYVAAADAAVLLYLLLQDGGWALGLWVVLVTCSLVHCILTLYREKIDQLHLPDCSQNPAQFYHFFYSYKQSFKSEEGHLNVSSKGQFEKIIYLHRASCKSKDCHLGGPLETISYKDMEEVVTRVLQSRKNESMSYRVIYQLWNLQLGRKCSVEALFDKPININQQFMIYSIDKLTKDSEVSLRNSESNKGAISKVFYDLIYEISACYSLFYEQLARTHPKMDLMVHYGTMIRQKIERLKAAYSDLLKSKLINFKMIELYMQFLTNFVGENALDKDDIGRVMKAQQNIYFEDISENYLPTISLYLETGSIENANSEAQKILQSTRFELKYKNVADVTYPPLTIDKLKQITDNEPVDVKDDPIFSFFRQSDKEYAFASIIFEERIVRQKKLMVIQMKRLKFSDQKNYLLVTSDFKLKIMTRKTVKVKNGGFRGSPLLLSWEELFNKYIAANKEKVTNNKMIKIPTAAKDCIMVVKRLRCLIEDYTILQVQMFVTSQLIRKNRNSICTIRRSLQDKKSVVEFQFHVGCNDENDKITYYGLKGNARGEFPLDRGTGLLPEFKQLQNELVSAIIEQNHLQYDKDIKTYRLFKGELYNVDLEDREAYNNLFQKHISQTKRIQLADNSSIQCYIFVAVILLGLALAALSITLIVQFQSASSSVSVQYSQFLNIESLIIDFTRIQSLLQNYASGFLSKFPDFSLQSEIGVSYGRIQDLKNQMLFNNDEFTIKFKSVEMTGSIIELVDVMLAHVTEVLSNGDLGIVEEIHSTCILQLNTMIKQAQAAIYGQVVGQLNWVSMISSMVLYCSLGVGGLLYFLMIFYCFLSNKQLKQALSSLLFISDSQAHMHQENAEKMKYAVEMIRKNFEVDSQNLLAVETDFKRRKNPKEAIQSKEIVYSITLMVVLGLAVHLSCLLLFETQFSSQLTDFQTMKDQAISTTTVYHTSAEITNYIEHTGTIDNTMLNIIRGNLTYVQYNLVSFLFSPPINSFIAKLYFENSCPLLIDNYGITPEICANTTPGFTIVNPFQIGLGVYINRQNYYLFNNLTQNYAHTGIYSAPFASVLTDLIQSFKGESLSKLGQTGGLVNMFNGCIIAIDLAYIFAFMVIYYYFRTQLKQIREILLFFDEKFKTKRTPPEDKDQIQVKNQPEESDESSEEERSLLEIEQEEEEHKVTLQIDVAPMKKKPSIQTSHLYRHFE